MFDGRRDYDKYSKSVYEYNAVFGEAYNTCTLPMTIPFRITHEYWIGSFRYGECE